MVGDFLVEYALCESTYKNMYLSLHPEENERHLFVRMNQVRSTVTRFNISIEDDVLESVFGSCEVSGERSAKKLRDCIVHKLSPSAIDELIARAEIINANMKTFLLAVIGDED